MTPDQAEKFRHSVFGPYHRPYNMPHPHWVYRVFDADDALLYIGCSLNPAQRLDGHAVSKVWWEFVRSITVESYPTKAEARVAEAAAIAAEKPRYNIKHKGERQSQSRTLVPTQWADARELLAADVEDGAA